MPPLSASPAPPVLSETSPSRSSSKTDGLVSWELWAAFVEVICRASDGAQVTPTIVWQRAIELGHQPDGVAGVGQHHAHPNTDINAEGALNETTQYAYNGTPSVPWFHCHSEHRSLFRWGHYTDNFHVARQI